MMSVVAKSIYRGRNPVDVPLYSLSNLVCYLRLPTPASGPGGLISRDSFSRPDSNIPLAAIGEINHSDLPPNVDQALFTFRSLVETFFLTAWAKRWWWGLGYEPLGDKKIARPALLLHCDRFLLAKQCDGLPLLSAQEQEERTQLYRGRVDFTETGDPIRLYPFTRAAVNTSSPRQVAIDPRYGFGNPILVKSGIRADVIASRFRAGESIAELVEDCELSPEEVEEAIRFDRGPFHSPE